MTSPNYEPKYVISIAAKIVGTETHTLRYYERLGLIQPYRSGGNVRYYSEHDIERLRRVKTLIDDLGINLAGAEVIMRMSERIRQLQNRITQMESELARLKQSETGIEKGKKEKKE